MWQQWALALVAFGIGVLAGMGVMSFCAMAGYNTQYERNTELRVALGELYRSVEADLRVTDNTWINVALNKAREVLRQ